MNAFVDPHIHSFYSDGVHSPEEVIILAKDAGLEGVCLTDHDTFEGARAFLQAGATHGVNASVGIEVTTYFEGHEVHMLVYGISPSRFAEAEDVFAAGRVARQCKVDRVIASCRKAGIIKGRLYDLKKNLPRPQKSFLFVYDIFRFVMATCGVTFSEAHNLLVIHDCFLPEDYAAFETPESVMKKALALGGRVVLAHPGKIGPRLSEVDNRDVSTRLIHKLIPLGLYGIEAYYYSYTSSQQNYFVRLARRKKLFASGCSDLHKKNSRPIGVRVMTFAEYLQLLSYT